MVMLFRVRIQFDSQNPLDRSTFMSSLSYTIHGVMERHCEAERFRMFERTQFMQDGTVVITARFTAPEEDDLPFAPLNFEYVAEELMASIRFI